MTLHCKVKTINQTIEALRTTIREKQQVAKTLQKKIGEMRDQIKQLKQQRRELILEGMSK